MASETFGLALLMKLLRLVVSEGQRFSGVSGAKLREPPKSDVLPA
jgi:hypothetical protein